MHRHDHSLPSGLGGAARAASAEQRDILRENARQIRFCRGRRQEFFDQNLFGEPAWDILLALYVIDNDQRRVGGRLPIWRVTRSPPRSVGSIIWKRTI
jgi:hypothetical protein